MVRKILAVVLIIIFVPVFMSTILAWDSHFTVLNSHYLAAQIDKSGIYDRFLDLAPKYIGDQIKANNKDQSLPASISTAEAENVFKEQFSRDWLKLNTELILNQTFNYLNGQSSTIDAKIDGVHVKNGLQDFIFAYVKSQVEALPVCKSGESQSVGNITCRPADETPDQLARNITDSIFSQKDSPFANINDNYDVGNYLTNSAPVSLAMIRQNIHNFNLSLYLLTLLSIILLAGIGLLIFRPLSSVLRYMATALLIPGILLLFSVLGSLSFPYLAKIPINNLPRDLTDSLKNLALAIGSGYFLNVLYISLALILISIILYILAAVFKRKLSAGPKPKLQQFQKEASKELPEEELPKADNIDTIQKRKKKKLKIDY